MGRFLLIAGGLASMHSVLKQKPSPLVPRNKLNFKAYNAAMEQIPEGGPQLVAVSAHGYAKRESIRRRTLEDNPVLTKLIAAKDSSAAKSAYTAVANKRLAPGKLPSRA